MLPSRKYNLQSPRYFLEPYKTMFPFSPFVTIYAGFAHAFKTDHLLTVGNIVSELNSTFKSVKGGLFWGLGYTSAILLMGVIILLLKVEVSPVYFNYVEAGVGIMLVVLGLFRHLKFKGFLSEEEVETPAG